MKSHYYRTKAAFLLAAVFAVWLVIIPALQRWTPKPPQPAAQPLVTASVSTMPPVQVPPIPPTQVPPTIEATTTVSDSSDATSTDAASSTFSETLAEDARWVPYRDVKNGFMVNLPETGFNSPDENAHIVSLSIDSTEIQNLARQLHGTAYQPTINGGAIAVSVFATSTSAWTKESCPAVQGFLRDKVGLLVLGNGITACKSVSSDAAMSHGYTTYEYQLLHAGQLIDISATAVEVSPGVFDPPPGEEHDHCAYQAENMNNAQACGQDMDALEAKVDDLVLRIVQSVQFDDVPSPQAIAIPASWTQYVDPGHGFSLRGPGLQQLPSNFSADVDGFVRLYVGGTYLMKVLSAKDSHLTLDGCYEESVDTAQQENADLRGSQSNPAPLLTWNDDTASSTALGSFCLTGYMHGQLGRKSYTFANPNITLYATRPVRNGVLSFEFSFDRYDPLLDAYIPNLNRGKDVFDKVRDTYIPKQILGSFKELP